MSDNLDAWDFNVDFSKAGMITFSGTAKANDPINSDRLLFEIMFIVHSSFETTTVVSSSSVKSEIIETETVLDEDNILNQAEIDAALEAEETPPEPEYGTKEVENKREITFENASHSIKVVKPLSKNCYLRHIEVEEGTLSPDFNKLTNAYKVIIDESTELKINFIKEDEKSTVVMQDEVNNQIVITVTAEDGSNNSDVLTIIRQADYNSNIDPNIENPDIPIDPGVNDSAKNNPLATIDSGKMFLVITLIVVSLVGIGVGGSMIYKGSRITTSFFTA